MADNDKDQAQTSGQAPAYVSYGDIVWTQFKKYKLSYYSLLGALGMFVLATIAPLIALNIPLYISIPAGVGYDALQGTHFPWFRALFDMNFFESGVDIFFNFLLFAMPVALIGWPIVAKTKGAALDRQEMKSLKGRYILLASAAIMLGFVVMYMADVRQPYVDYVTISKIDGVSSLFPPLKLSYRDVDLSAVGQGPSWAHLLGTDPQGRDVFTRMLYGTRISLTIGVLAVGLYTAIGMVLGGLAGYFGGRVDMVVLRMIEVMICFPSFFLILTLRGFVEKASVFHIMIIIGLTGWTGIARLVRAEFLRLRQLDFVQAAIALGLPQGRIIFRHVMPNALGPVLVSATFGVAGAIITEASLSFLGLGPTTAPSWGQILDTGRGTGQWLLILVPGFAIFVTVSLLNLAGEGFRDAIDPKMRR
jgi:peptide/nickel transport system permease protein